ncbi:MAG: hypothetical protein R6U98_12535, partial [Pirellulaceae bacterium]
DGQNDSFPVYTPKGTDMPLVYFDSRSYGNVNVYYPPPSSLNDNTGAATPYLSSRSSDVKEEWVNENTFQIISAGRDNHYGSYACLVEDPSLYPVFPTGENYDPTLASPEPGFPGVGGDNDNITNFSGGGTLEDAKP